MPGVQPYVAEEKMTDKKPKCPKCNDTGFSGPGKICDCVTGKKPEFDLPPGFEILFGERRGKN